MANFNPNTESLPKYTDKSLIYNWFEERCQRSVASASNTNVSDMPTRDRVLTHYQPNISEFQSTKTLTEAGARTAKAPVKVKKPSMYTEENLAARLETYRTPDKIAYTVGVQGGSALPNRYLHTTNQHLLEDAPETARSKNPELYQSLDTTNFKKQVFRNENFHSNIADATKAGKGHRGEFTRSPAESGSVYGVSTFFDEYSTWGNKPQAGTKSSNSTN
uniref:Uncharacterized protein n=1 Tax=Polytomella parva TaxID=51329 RepID=A0A7S0VC28_9CHLO|mmetsp:Transcript_30028/g.54906  ORF Transcript_30028/g.54906 Transcript_30028/m.54906 type:complete len:219 (+) Transcript_30028:137-793(+)|eukprot:CAMPEP_0175039422 /NCGR_PEP_ID=MMETSP0052_2-20121109/569_1 /TAXON_ID=51329 ORGANISM="Polytomella parva, Strain SAG 63-3" /NCGR_SAMPLE_ID=MMETSP0052_2 /ASSEMBLY_ACC=CAM_ASM_000194 /LENGTH=218 /DNA_ID=CAMNT_0016301261 /DNA_START=123 /DNA_END=779 /DNA_ORIENTATION=+